MTCALDSDSPPPLAAPSTLLSTRDLSRRWLGLPRPKTLRAWRETGRGPRFQIRPSPGGKRLAAYSLDDIQAYELARSSIPRKKPWSGVFLSAEQLIERWRGTADEMGWPTLRWWRQPRGRRSGPPFVLVHRRHRMYPLEAVEIFELERESRRVARSRAEAFDTEPIGPTFAEMLAKGPPV